MKFSVIFQTAFISKVVVIQIFIRLKSQFYLYCFLKELLKRAMIYLVENIVDLLQLIQGLKESSLP